MERSRTDRIIADWDTVSRQASRPALPRRTVATTALPGSTIAGIAVLVVAIAAAGVWLNIPRGAGSPGAGASASPMEAWGPLAVVPPSSGSGQALAAGTLHITDTCVFLEDAGGDLELLVWPADRTTWSADSHAITFENLDGSTVTLRDSDRVMFGGGGDSVAESGVSGEEWVRRTEWVAPPASSCPLDARWSVGEVVTTPAVPTSSPTVAPFPTPSPEPAAWLPPWAGPATPTDVVTRSALPFCGVEEGGPFGFVDAGVRDCFLAALETGQPAEFATIRSTLEGDPIATITRALPDGGLEILVDRTQDRFGAGVWSRTICRGFTADPKFGFIQDACDEGVVIP